MSLYVPRTNYNTGEVIEWDKASTPELAHALTEAVQCPNCDDGTVYATDPRASEREHLEGLMAVPLPCPDCSNGRLDGTALQAAADRIAAPLEYAKAAVDEYLRVQGETE